MKGAFVAPVVSTVVQQKLLLWNVSILGRDSMKSGDANNSSQNASSCKLTRRNFIAKFSIVAFASTLVLTLVGLVRSLMPWVSSEPSSKFKIGAARNYPKGAVKNFPEENVIVIRDEDGLFAISLICTHLGCVVTHEETGFICPCHGSLFTAMGELIKGPAPKGLNWLEVSRLPGGQLVVDNKKIVRFGTKLKLDNEQVS